VSSKEQAANGQSLAVQMKIAKEYADTHALQLGTASNCNVAGVFVDPGVSAWNITAFERPGFNEMYFNNARPGDTILIQSLDRAFRSVQDFANTWPKFEACGINVRFIHGNVDMSSANGKFLAHTMAAFAQYKSDMISQRVKEANEIRKLRKKTEPEKRREKYLAQQPNAALGKLAGWRIDAAKSGERQDGDLPERDFDRRVFGYTRVSTADQDIEVQSTMVDRLMQRYAEQHGYEHAGIYSDDGVSAFSTNWPERPDGKLLWEEMQRGDLIVVVRIDRIFRSIHDMANCMRKLLDMGVDLVTADGIDTRTPDGLHMVEMTAMFAAWESRDISWRTKLAMENLQRTNGRWLQQTNLPRFMKVHQFENDWRPHIDMDVVAEYQQVQQLLETGMRYNEVSDVMERAAAEREGRPVLPSIRFNKLRVMRGAGRKNASKAEMKNLRKWFESRKPDKNGEYARDWEYKRIHHQRRFFDEITEILKECEA
jgi:DNA invertase Pin-like site-specific DNA recombinase